MIMIIIIIIIIGKVREEVKALVRFSIIKLFANFRRTLLTAAALGCTLGSTQFKMITLKVQRNDRVEKSGRKKSRVGRDEEREIEIEREEENSLKASRSLARSLVRFENN